MFNVEYFSISLIGWQLFKTYLCNPEPIVCADKMNTTIELTLQRLRAKRDYELYIKTRNWKIYEYSFQDKKIVKHEDLYVLRNETDGWIKATLTFSDKIKNTNVRSLFKTNKNFYNVEDGLEYEVCILNSKNIVERWDNKRPCNLLNQDSNDDTTYYFVRPQTKEEWDKLYYVDEEMKWDSSTIRMNALFTYRVKCRCRCQAEMYYSIQSIGSPRSKIYLTDYSTKADRVPILPIWYSSIYDEISCYSLEQKCIKFGELKEELIRTCFHPNRVERMVERYGEDWMENV